MRLQPRGAAPSRFGLKLARMPAPRGPRLVRPDARNGVPGTFQENKVLFAKFASFMGDARSSRMTNPSRTIKKGVCRRLLLKTVPAIAGAIISTIAMAESSRKPNSLTKPPNISRIPKTVSSALVAFSSGTSLLQGNRSSESPRADGANSSPPSQPKVHRPSSALRSATASFGPSRSSNNPACQ